MAFSPHYVHTETEDGQILTNGYLRWPHRDWIRNEPYGRRLYVFHQPLFDSSYNYAIFSMEILGGSYGCFGASMNPYYLYQKVDGHWKKVHASF
jgi:hypothetical protein